MCPIEAGRDGRMRRKQSGGRDVENAVCRSALSGAKSLKVSGRFPKKSRSAETIGGDRFDHDCLTLLHLLKFADPEAREFGCRHRQRTPVPKHGVLAEQLVSR